MDHQYSLRVCSLYTVNRVLLSKEKEMYCKKRQEELGTGRQADLKCSVCWQGGQKAIWRKRMIEDYGYKPGSGKTAHLLRRDCRTNYLYAEQAHCQRPIPKSMIME